MTLSNEQRNNLRKAITACDGWKNFRKEHGITSADLSSGDMCIEVAKKLGVDWPTVVGIDADTETTTSNDTDEMFPRDVDQDTDTEETAQETAQEEQEPKPMTVKGDTKKVSTLMEQLMQELAGSVDEDQVRAIVDAQVAPLRAMVENSKPRVVVKDAGGRETGTLPPVRHCMAEDLLRVLAPGNGINVWLSGPAGSGKTYAAKQAADALGLEFGFHGAMMMAHELIGFVDGNGTYHETVFVRLFREGGVCLLDEIDAGSDEARLTLNAALANGMMSLPNGELVERHPDFRCIAAANTFGQGATAEYVGRCKVDAATLDRFGVKLAWTYDADLEAAICGMPEWAKVVQEARKTAEQAGLKILITPRASTTGADLIRSGFTAKRAAELTFLAGLGDEQADIILRSVKDMLATDFGSAAQKEAA